MIHRKLETEENTCILKESYILIISRISYPTCYGQVKLNIVLELCSQNVCCKEKWRIFSIPEKPIGHDVMLYALNNLFKNSFLRFESLPSKKYKAEKYQ